MKTDYNALRRKAEEEINAASSRLSTVIERIEDYEKTFLQRQLDRHAEGLRNHLVVLEENSFPVGENYEPDRDIAKINTKYAWLTTRIAGHVESLRGFPENEMRKNFIELKGQ
jgi:hypothetical protein